MAKILTMAELPDALVESWLQHLRDFDDDNPGCHFRVVANTDQAIAKIADILKVIDTPFDEVAVYRRVKPS